MDLTIEQIERVIADEKENCQRKVNQGVLKEDRVQQLMYMGGMEALDRMLYSVRLAVGIRAGLSEAANGKRKLRVVKARGE